MLRETITALGEMPIDSIQDTITRQEIANQGRRSSSIAQMEKVRWVGLTREEQIYFETKREWENHRLNKEDALENIERREFRLLNRDNWGFLTKRRN